MLSLTVLKKYKCSIVYYEKNHGNMVKACVFIRCVKLNIFNNIIHNKIIPVFKNRKLTRFKEFVVFEYYYDRKAI